jgi:hypothetical protein
MNECCMKDCEELLYSDVLPGVTKTQNGITTTWCGKHWSQVEPKLPHDFKFKLYSTSV